MNTNTLQAAYDEIYARRKDLRAIEIVASVAVRCNVPLNTVLHSVAQKNVGKA